MLVRNHSKGPLLLPPVDGTRARYTLQPGQATEVPDDLWSKHRERPTVHHWLQAGRLTEESAAEGVSTKREKPVPPQDEGGFGRDAQTPPTPDVSQMSVPQARAYLRQVSDRETLRAVSGSDTRSTVRRAAEERLAKLGED